MEFQSDNGESTYGIRSREDPISSSEQQRESSNVDNDLLGLDKPIKLTTRAKIAKIDDDRILNKPNGVKYIVKNYNKVNRIVKKNDQKLAQKLSTDKYKSLPKGIQRKLKIQTELDSLSSILQFYQIWCHSIFPKANFKDCIKLVRVYGSKSPHMKLYRRELLDQELMKMKQDKGIIDNVVSTHINEDADTSGIALPLANPEGTNTTASKDVEGEDDDDDWSFMNRSSTRGKNSLFIDDDDEVDDDLYRVADKSVISDSAQASKPKDSEDVPDFGDFSDTDLFDNPGQPDGEDENEGEDFEMDLMREMGL